VLVAPSSPAKFVAAGVGNQNYTCTPAGNYSSIGAVAHLYDISSLSADPTFSKIQDCLYDAWTKDSDTNPLDGGLDNLVQGQFRLSLLGVHTFVEFNGASDPSFDFTQSTGDSSDFVTATKAGSIPSSDSQSVAWLSLKGVSGDLATQVFRVETKGGNPPSTCTPGSGVITVKYAAQYWFF